MFSRPRGRGVWEVIADRSRVRRIALPVTLPMLRWEWEMGSEGLLLPLNSFSWPLRKGSIEWRRKVFRS